MNASGGVGEGVGGCAVKGGGVGDGYLEAQRGAQCRLDAGEVGPQGPRVAPHVAPPPPPPNSLLPPGP